MGFDGAAHRVQTRCAGAFIEFGDVEVDVVEVVFGRQGFALHQLQPVAAARRIPTARIFLGPASCWTN